MRVLGSAHVLMPPRWGQGGGAVAEVCLQGPDGFRSPEPRGTPWSLHLNSLCASSSRRKSTPSQTFCPRHAVQSQRFSKHFHFSVLEGGDPIYSLIFRTLRGSVKNPTEGDVTLAVGVQACCRL